MSPFPGLVTCHVCGGPLHFILSLKPNLCLAADYCKIRLILEKKRINSEQIATLSKSPRVALINGSPAIFFEKLLGWIGTRSSLYVLISVGAAGSTGLFSCRGKFDSTHNLTNRLAN
ncbi:hypothetical protein K435DRAFT_786185 [Dendrothele bispora CBS 962.96]|uniref:Uncharacterized protein n=1 Tax=Dendrothele bispora (strain CBS 962.96) TaxID=1314807 RepID=A0A4S8KSB8_DENBC|nr:hypothetical protein K435DRAFT_786185 [Dendrothele bispora CBS 962.96]